MKLNNLLLLILLTALVIGCGLGSSGGGSSTPQKPYSTVSPTQIVSITVAPAAASISTGTTQQFKATGEFGDSSTRDVTTEVTWLSSSTDIATVDSSGMANANSPATTAATMIVAKSGSVSGSAILTVTGGSAAPADNVLPISVNGALCSSATSYLNKPCVSVTICTPNNISSSSCETISDILLDTGSFGLRVFSQVLGSAGPSPIGSGSGQLAECVQFGDGTSLWGPVQTASVILGNEPPVVIPIQVVDSSFPGIPALCANAEQSPTTARFNGILGVGVFGHDCGSKCVSSPNIGIYFSCSGSTCTGTTVPLSSQVQNPVMSLPTDSNGVIVELQGVPPSGATSASGILVLGIGTRTNNTPLEGVASYSTDQFGEVRTVFNGNAYPSIIDSGSNGLFFTPLSSGVLPNCPSPNSAWFCPTPSAILSATNAGASGTSPTEIFFQVGNLTSLVGSSNRVFSNIGGAAPGLFDWGLPFYFGRNIYIGIDGKSSSLGTGSYFAY